MTTEEKYQELVSFIEDRREHYAFLSHAHFCASSTAEGIIGGDVLDNILYFIETLNIKDRRDKNVQKED